MKKREKGDNTYWEFSARIPMMLIMALCSFALGLITGQKNEDTHLFMLVGMLIGIVIGILISMALNLRWLKDE